VSAQSEYFCSKFCQTFVSYLVKMVFLSKSTWLIYYKKILNNITVSISCITCVENQILNVTKYTFVKKTMYSYFLVTKIKYIISNKAI